MTESHFGSDCSCFIEVIDKLVIVQSVVVYILGFQNPFKIKARRGGIFIMDPPSLFKSSFNIWITSSANEDLRFFINLVFLFPCGKIGDVWEDDFLRIVSFKERF